jgi:hypothetical protein
MSMLRTIGLLSVGGVILAAGALVAGNWRFDQQAQAEVERLLALGSPPAAEVVTEDMLTPLPAPVQRFMRYAGVVGQPVPRVVRLTQRGTFYTDAKNPSAGMPFTAQQVYIINRPGFVWTVWANVGGLPLMRGTDSYRGGEGRMLIMLGGLFPVVNMDGAAMNQGAMMRHLSEMIWFPTAFFGGGVTWEAVDDDSARVTLDDGTQTVSGLMRFDAEGKLVSFEAQRFHVDSGTMQTWVTPVREYGELAGLRVPVRGEGTWKLPDGDFTYIDAQILEVRLER